MRTKDQIQLENLYLSMKRQQMVKEGTWSDVGHAALDVASLATFWVPGLNIPFDLTNTLWYAEEGDWLNAAFSLISCIPEAGELAKLPKIAGWISKGSKALKELGTVGKFAERGIGKVGTAIATAAPKIAEAKTLIQQNQDKVNEVLDAAAKNEKLAQYVPKIRESLMAFTGQKASGMPSDYREKKSNLGRMAPPTSAPPVPGSAQAATQGVA